MADDAATPDSRHGHEIRCDRFVAALAAFGFLAPQGHAGAAFGLLLLLAVALAQWRRFIGEIARDGFFVVWCILSVYLMIRAAGAALEFPETSNDQWEDAFRLARSGFFVVLVSWCLNADTKRVIWLFGAALAGFCLEVIVDLDIGALDRMLRGGDRNMLGVALPIGLLGAIAIVGLLSFLPRLVRLASRQPRGVQVVLYAAIAASAMLLTLVQVITQSRAVVAMLAVLVPAMIAWQFLRWPGGPHGRLALGMVYGALIGLFSVALSLVGPKLVDKFESGYSRIAPYVATGQLHDMPESSLGWRVHLNVHGAHLASERPWFGWGPGTSATRDLSDRYGAADLGFLNHLHNTYLEIVVRLGLTGATLYLVVVGILARHGIRSRPDTGWMPGDVAMFVLAGAALIAGWSLIDFHLINWNFIIPLVLLAAVIHTYANGDNGGGRKRA